MIEPPGVRDDLGRESVAMIVRALRAHGGLLCRIHCQLDSTARSASQSAAALVSAPAAIWGPGLCRQWAGVPRRSTGGRVGADGGATDDGERAVKKSVAAARRAGRNTP